MPSIPTTSPLPIRLEDYSPPAFLIDTVRLDVDIRPDAALVAATLACRRNPAVSGKPPLVLVRRGWELGRREADIVARAVRLGAVCATPNETFDAIARHPDSRAIAG